MAGKIWLWSWVTMLVVTLGVALVVGWSMGVRLGWMLLNVSNG